MSVESLHGPDFLVIGAQKSGTTTLWEDLRAHPEVGMSDKESNGLLDPQVTSVTGRRRYSALFPPGDSLTRGEVCTTYSMLPEHAGVVERAQALNPNLRVIYIVREPLARVVSHHHHDFSLNLCGPDINTEVRAYPPLVDHTRYGTQFTPWVQAFGLENVLVIKFEDYMHNRDAGLRQVHDFLSLRSVPLHSHQAYNTSDGKKVATGYWSQLSQSSLYRQFVRPLISERLRRRLMSAVLPTAPPRPEQPSPETLKRLASILQPEVDALARLTESRALWDLNDSLAQRQVDT